MNKMEYPRIIILARLTPQAYYLINRIAQQWNVVGVLSEEPPRILRYWKQIRWRFKRFGILKLTDQILFRLWEKVILKPCERAKIELYIPPDMNGKINNEDIPIHNFESLNTPEAIAKLKALNPDVIIVFGTSILKTPIIDVCREGIINLHTGIIPEYRGVYSAFWVLYNEDFDTIGVTVHLVREKLDAGEILYQERITFNPEEDSFQTLFARQVTRGTDLILQAITDMASGGFKTTARHESKGKLYFHPGLTDYFRMRKRIEDIVRK